MQHRYSCDVGDFGKYALLNALAGDDLRLGVLWYLNEASESNNDGKFTNYDRLRTCDPILHRKLSEILKSGKRSLDAIEAAGVLPASTIYYRDALPMARRPCFSDPARKQQTKLREDWFSRASTKLQEANLIFLDPDNGMAGKTAKHRKASVKYVFADELAHFLRTGQSVVLYQHQRRQRLDRQVAQQLSELTAHAKSAWTLIFCRQSIRIYFVLPASELHRRVLLDRCKAFLKSRWGLEEHFRQHRPPV